MFRFLVLSALSAGLVQSVQPATHQFEASTGAHRVNVPNGATPIAPRLDPPKGYKSVQVPDYIADTYMKFASTETAHDFRLYGIETRLNTLETDREKYDRVDIDSLKETRTKALVYFAIATTLVTVVWGLLAALAGFVFKSYIWPRLQRLWAALSPKEAGAFGGTSSLSFAAASDETEPPRTGPPSPSI